MCIAYESNINFPTGTIKYIMSYSNKVQYTLFIPLGGNSNLTLVMVM